jgi:AbiU2
MVCLRKSWGGGLRQDLDVYCLISVNATAINKIGTGQNFFGHLQRLSIEAISLNVFKIFEDERGYELNSVQGVMNQLRKSEQNLTVLNASNLRIFIIRYDGQIAADTVSSLEATVDKFRAKHKNDLERFKTFRDKVVAHSEYGVTIENLRPYSAMEELFDFGADFYSLIATTFLGVLPFDIKTQLHVKPSFESVLRDLV